MALQHDLLSCAIIVLNFPAKSIHEAKQTGDDVLEAGLHNFGYPLDDTVGALPGHPAASQHSRPFET